MRTRALADRRVDLPLAGVLLLLFVGLACRGGRLPAPDVVARIGGEEILYDQFERYLYENVGEGAAGLTSDVLAPLFDLFLSERLHLRMAVDRGLVRPGATGRQAVVALVEAELARGPGEVVIREYYESHQEQFSRSERVRLRQILVDQREAAEQALALLRGGAEFGDVARALSKEPRSQFGGDQGELAKEDLPPAFADAVFELQEGEVSEILAADYGFHIFQVVEHLPSEVVPLEEVRGQIVEMLRGDRAGEVLERLVAQAQEDYNVQVYARNLPFDYSGAFSADTDPS